MNGTSITINQSKVSNHNIKIRVYDNTNINYAISTTSFNLTPTKILIGQLYQKILGRIPVQSELDYWVTGNINDATHGILFSDEATKRLTTNELFIKAIYEGILGRTPNSSEISHALDYINSNGKLAYYKSVANSPEFVNDCTINGVARTDYTADN